MLNLIIALVFKSKNKIFPSINLKTSIKLKALITQHINNFRRSKMQRNFYKTAFLMIIKKENGKPNSKILIVSTINAHPPLILINNEKQQQIINTVKINQLK